MGSKASETAGYDTDWYLDKIISVDPGDKTTTTVKTIMGAAALNYHTWRTDNDQLLQRLGDLRQSGDSENGVWLRLKGTKISRNADSVSRINILPMSWATIRCCGKLMIIPAMAVWPSAMATAAAVMLVAVALTIIKPSDYMVRKSTKRDIIWTWCSNTPIWIMILAFWTQKGKKISGDYDNKGLAFSAEYGRKNALQRGWYIEPQAQLTLGYLDGGSYFTSNRVKVEQSHIKSVLGRVGFQLAGISMPKTNIYIKADLLHEFGGGYDVKMTAANGDSLYPVSRF